MPDGGGQLVDQRIDPHRIAQAIEMAGKAWADAAHAANLLEKTKDSVLAELILSTRDDVEPGEKKMAWTEAEMRAKASEDWQNHVYAMIEARHKANLARVHYDATTAKFEALRTAEASRRAELQNLGRM